MPGHGLFCRFEVIPELSGSDTAIGGMLAMSAINNGIKNTDISLEGRLITRYGILHLKQA